MGLMIVIYDTESIYFILADHPGHGIDKMPELNSILARVGVEIKFDTEPRDGYRFLSIYYSKTAADKAFCRGAGRKRKFIDVDLTVAEVRESVRLRGADDVCAELGISRSTLFRRLRQDDECCF